MCHETELGPERIQGTKLFPDRSMLDLTVVVTLVRCVNEPTPVQLSQSVNIDHPELEIPDSCRFVVFGDVLHPVFGRVKLDLEIGSRCSQDVPIRNPAVDTSVFQSLTASWEVGLGAR